MSETSFSGWDRAETSAGNRPGPRAKTAAGARTGSAGADRAFFFFFGFFAVMAVVSPG